MSSENKKTKYIELCKIFFSNNISDDKENEKEINELFNIGWKIKNITSADK